MELYSPPIQAFRIVPSYSSLLSSEKHVSSLKNTSSISSACFFIGFPSFLSSISRSYSRPDQSISFIDPTSGGAIEFPPCLVTPATANRDYAKGSVMDRLLLNQRAPSTACFESLLLDSLLLLNERSATVQDLLSSMKSNPFINSSDASSLLSVGKEGGSEVQAIENVLHYYLSVNPHKHFSINLNQQSLKYSLCISKWNVCVNQRVEWMHSLVFR